MLFQRNILREHAAKGKIDEGESGRSYRCIHLVKLLISNCFD